MESAIVDPVERLESLTAALAEAVERRDMEAARGLIAERAAAVEALADRLGVGGYGAGLEGIGERTADLIERLKHLRVAIRSELRDLHRESILVRAYLAPEP
ncbi:MAG: hypothetical protein R2729_32855 [Bryobacteraceae bacterium]